MNKKLIFWFALCSAAFSLSAQNVQISYNGSSNYTLVERTDLRRYDNNRYVGLTSREVRSFIYGTDVPAKYEDTAAANDKWYDGNFYVMEETHRALNDVGSGIHDSIPSVFHITSDGQLIMHVDNGYPSFRSFPAFSNQRMKSGDKWQAQAMRAVDPMNKGIVTKMPMQVEYTFISTEQYHGETVYRLSAQWATRYGKTYIDFGGDKELKEAQGSHKASILVSAASGAAILVHDIVDETFVYADGNRVTFKGTINLFTEYPPALDTDKLLPVLQRVAKLSSEQLKSLETPVNTSAFLPGSPIAPASKQPETNPGVTSKPSVASATKPAIRPGIAAKPNNPVNHGTLLPGTVDGQNGGGSAEISVDRTSAGLRLTIQNLQFKADSDQLLPGEEKRLDEIAAVLKQAPQSQFLVEGHTASVGRPEGEQTLSEQRAKAIAQALSKRGIQAGKFICKGSGGTKPVADNSTAEGKAKNRRVEITILE